MKINLKALRLTCKQSKEEVIFGEQLTFVHGQMSRGKSSVAKLVDFCFGGKLERTPAIGKELVSVTLEAQIGSNIVLIDRHIDQKTNIGVSWIDQEKNAFIAVREKCSEAYVGTAIFESFEIPCAA